MGEISVGYTEKSREKAVDISLKEGEKAEKTEEDNSEGRVNTIYSVEYCGYFPAENPKYSIIVSMNKVGLPASGNLMAGSVFKEIVNYIEATK